MRDGVYNANLWFVALGADYISSIVPMKILRNYLKFEYSIGLLSHAL